jgi:RHS repeat-associated protein
MGSYKKVSAVLLNKEILMKQRLLIVVALFFLGSGKVAAQDAWEFCANHGVTGVNQCFGSLIEAEAWMRQDSATAPRGRAFLVQTSVSMSTAWKSTSAKTYQYSVPSRPGKLTGQEFAKAAEFTSFGGNTDWVCGCDNGVPTCRGGYGTCGPGQCQACPISNGDVSVFKSVLSQSSGQQGSVCNVTFTGETPWPQPPINSARLSTYPDGTGATPSNIGSYAYSNSYGGYDGDFATFDPRSVYNKTFVRNFGTINSSGVCAGNNREKVVMSRTQVFECEAGLTPVALKLNQQGYLLPAEVGDINKVCSSSQTGAITSKVVPSQQSCYGNPCIPTTGAKTQQENDFQSDSLAFSRNYNSIRLAPSNMMVGPGWYHSYSDRLIFSGNSFFLYVSDDGNLERLDLDTSQNIYRSVNEYGSFIRKVGTFWELRTTDGLLKTFDAQYRLISAQQLDDAGSLVTLAYADSSPLDPGLQGTPRGALESVTDARGRSLRFHYSVINAVIGTGSGALDPCIGAVGGANCRGRRLQWLELPDGTRADYAYDFDGNIASVEYPDGTSKAYHYNESSNLCPSGSSACTGHSVPAGGFPHALTGISFGLAGGLAMERYATFQFDYKGRVISSSHFSGADAVGISYGTGAGGVETATVTFASGKKRTITISTRSGIFRRASQEVDEGDGQTLTRTFGFVSTSATLASVVDPAGVRTNYTYPSAFIFKKTEGLTASGATTPQTRSNEILYDAQLGRPVERSTLNGAGIGVAKATTSYNTRGQVLTTSTMDPATSTSRITTVTYCEQSDVTTGVCPLVGLVKMIDGPRTDVTDIISYTFYASDDATCLSAPNSCSYRKGDLWKVTNTLGQATEMLKYDGAGRVLSVTDANGVITDLEYHPRGWLTARKVRGTNDAVETDDAITRIDYWPTGLVKKVIQPDGAFTTYTYDAAHRLTDIADNAGNKIHYTLDNTGNRTQEDTKDPANALKRTLSRVFSQLGQLQTQADAQANTTDFTYDANGNTDTATDALDRVTDNNYDPLNRLSRTLQDVGGINVETKFAYDALDNLTQVTDPKGLNTGYTYNGLGDLTQLSSPDTGTTTYTYDSAGNRQTQTDARGQTSTYSYDALNRLTGIAYATPSLNVAYTYDATQATCVTGEAFSIGRLTRLSDVSGTTQYCYDRFGNLVRKVQTTNGIAFTVRYAYTLAGQLSSVTYPDGAIANYVRGAQGRTTQVNVQRAGAATEVLLDQASYHPFGPVAGWTYGNGRQLLRPLNQNYQPTAIQDAGVGGLSVGFQYDPVGNLTQLTPAASTTPLVKFDYDALSRLTAFKDGPTDVAIESYAYDATGNRQSFTNTSGTQAYTYPSTSHRLNQVGAVARTYDSAGNTTAIGGIAKEFNYDDTGRMSQVMQNAVVQKNYAYNGKGEQVRKYAGATNTYTVYDESGHWLGDYDNTGAALQQAIWLDDLPVGLIASGNQLHYVEPDHLGTPRVVIEVARNVPVWTWDLKGEIFGSGSPNQDPDSDSNPFVFNLRFPGQQYDVASGMNQNGFRDYEAGVGRYSQSDPIGLSGGLNTYGYAVSSPLKWIDPSGLQSRFILRPGMTGPAGVYNPNAPNNVNPEIPQSGAGGWPQIESPEITADGLLESLYRMSPMSVMGQLDRVINDTLTNVCESNNCPPCRTVSGRIIPVGIIGYRPLDVIPDTVMQHGVYGSHHNIFIANQYPHPKCDCFWAKQKWVSKPEDLQSNWVPVEPFAN